MAHGSVCISIDVELAWGIWDKPSAAYHDRCALLELEITRRLVDLFDSHEVSATWAIVGQLLERDDRAARSSAHGERIWYAPDVIDAIRRARTPQDIGSHSFAHVYFQETPRETVGADLARAKAVHTAHGLAFTSFVFPRNQVAHVDLLRDHGVRVYRSVDDAWHLAVRERVGLLAGRAANLADKMLPIPPRTVEPVDRGGIIELPSSMLLMARNGLRRAIHPAIAVAKARLGIESARRTGRTFHLWFHPSNFYYDTDRQLATLGAIVRTAAALRDRDELDIRPMAAYAA